MSGKRYEPGLYRRYVASDDRPCLCATTSWYEYDRDPAAEHLVAFARRVLRWASERDGEAGLVECLGAIMRARRIYPNDIELAETARLLVTIVEYLEDPESFVEKGQQDAVDLMGDDCALADKER
jgi:hypothetical protein